MNRSADDTRASALAGVSVGMQSIFYAPEFAGIAPYATALAEYMAAHGGNVDVYAALPHYPVWSYGSGPTPRRRTDFLNGVRINRHRVRLPPVHTGRERARYEMSFAARLLLRPPPAHDLNIAIVPSLGGGLAAALWKRFRRTPLAVIVQDLSGPAASQSGLNGSTFVARCAIALEGFVLRSADSVVIVSESFTHYVLGYGVPEDRISLCPNWSRLAPATASRQATRQAMSWADGEFIVLHTGNMGFKQGLDQVIDACSVRPADANVRFVLMGQGNTRAELEMAAINLDGLDIVDPVSEKMYPDILEAADALLVCERETVRDMALPSKLAAYFTAGKPVLAMVRPGGATAHELERAGAALFCLPNDPGQLFQHIESLTSDPHRAAGLGAAGRAYAQQHLAAAPRLRATVDSVLQALGAPPHGGSDTRWARLRRRLDVAERAKKLAFGLGHRSSRRALRFGVGASIEHLEVLRATSPDFIVDVGANRGQFLLAAAVTCPDAEIVALEPLSTPFATLEATAALFPDRASALQVAISDTTTTRDMFVADADDSSSLHRPTATQLAFAPRSRIVETQSVQTKTLDLTLAGREFGECSLLKIDVQGHEHAVLSGAGSSLQKFDHVIVEVSHGPLYEQQPTVESLISILTSAGFGPPVAFHHDDLAGRRIQSDLLFSRTSSTAPASHA